MDRRNLFLLPDSDWHANDNAIMLGGFEGFVSEPSRLHAMHLERIQVGLGTSIELEPFE